MNADAVATRLRVVASYYESNFVTISLCEAVSLLVDDSLIGSGESLELAIVDALTSIGAKAESARVDHARHVAGAIKTLDEVRALLGHEAQS